MSAILTRRRGVLKYPRLWQGCIGAYTPSVFGPAGDTCFDASQYSRHASVNGAAAADFWAMNNGLYSALIAGGDYLDCGRCQAIEGVAQFAYSFWFRRRAANSTMFVMKAADGANKQGVEIWSDGVLYVEVTAGGSQYGTIMSNDALWHHFVMSFDGLQATNETRLRIYLDGIEKAPGYNGTIPALTSTSNANLILGRQNYSATDGDGNLDDIRIYNRPLLPGEVSTLAMRRGVAFETLPHRMTNYLQEAPVSVGGVGNAYSYGAYY
jgi:hypothetical protein